MTRSPQSLRCPASQPDTGGSAACFVGLRESNRVGEVERRQNRARPWVGRRHRCALVGERVGPAGKAYGLDMTDEMLALANENKRKAGAENVEFLKGEIENIPLPDNSVDVVISNCVINLSSDKARVLREAYRVLKPGGRFAVSDVVTRGESLPEIRKSVLLWVGCVAGALDETDYCKKLVAGFENVEIEPTRTYRAADAGNSSPPLASTQMRSHRKWMGNFSAPSCVRPSQFRSNRVAVSLPAVNNERNTSDAPQRSLRLYGQLRALHHGRSHFE